MVSHSCFGMYLRSNVQSCACVSKNKAFRSSLSADGSYYRIVNEMVQQLYVNYISPSESIVPSRNTIICYICFWIRHHHPKSFDSDVRKPLLHGSQKKHSYIISAVPFSNPDDRSVYATGKLFDIFRQWEDCINPSFGSKKRELQPIKITE
jgi:hypothetical protein